MRLIDLDAHFIRHTDRGWRHVDTIEEATGVSFLCPKCFAANGGAAGTHTVVCWSRSAGAPEHIRPGPGRWRLVGTGIADLILDADPPGTARSVQLHGGCAWHGFVGGAGREKPGDAT